MIFVSSPCALEISCAKGKEASASKRIRGRNIAVAPLGLVVLLRMPRIKLFEVAEIPNLPTSDNRGSEDRHQPNCRLRGCGDCAKIEVPAVAGKVPESAFCGRFEIRARIKRQKKKGKTS